VLKGTTLGLIIISIISPQTFSNINSINLVKTAKLGIVSVWSLGLLLSKGLTGELETSSRRHRQLLYFDVKAAQK
jgi:hypothetical protein